MGRFQLAGKDQVADLWIEEEAYTGVKKIAQKVKADIKAVTDQEPKFFVKLKKSKENVIIAGTYGKSPILSKLEQEKRLDLEKVKGKREVYQVAIVDQPCERIQKALVICGSDKRGTIYGLFQISEWLGVSPWVYFGDVKPAKRMEVSFELDEPYTSKEPSVKYRGFFINDEWPSFGSWTFGHFGGFTAEMYDHVFELLLRLKGNYLWPAMWSSSFSLDGPGLASSELADEYGVVMGQSHHEPCLRASEEWDIYKGEGTGYGTEWNYYTNKEGLLNYWKDGLKRSGKYETVITIGMRGERDSSMLGEDSTLKENIDLLKDIITEQRKLIAEHVNPNLDEVPQMLALYKEVEAYFYGDEETEGLDQWPELDGVTLMLCEDNFGNMRTLPEAAKKDRKGGWGMYYHFDYHGAPISYEWINSTPLSKVWEQMTMAYDYGIKDLWIVNVGDLKPQELPLSYFMALAYDFDQWGTGSINQTHEFTKQWISQQFAGGFDEAQQADLLEVLEGYVRLNGRCRPEVLSSQTYQPVLYRETERIRQYIDNLSKKAEQLLMQVPKALYDAYYELVYFPAMATFNLNKMQTASGLNALYAASGSSIANTYAEEVAKCIRKDGALTMAYHQLGGGKWSGMASSNHIGFTHWNDEDWRYPTRQIVEPASKARLIVRVEGCEKTYTSGIVKLRREVSPKEEIIKIWLENGGKAAYEYEVISKAPWLEVSKVKGRVELQDSLFLKINERALNGKEEARVQIKGAESMVQLVIEAEAVKRVKEPMTFMMQNDHLAIEVEHYLEKKEARKAQWQVIEDYGRTQSGLKVFPTTAAFQLGEEAPTLTYGLEVKEAGLYQIEVQCAPSNPLKHGGKLRYGIRVNEAEWQAVSMVPDDFKGGDWNDPRWCAQVLENINRSFMTVELKVGYNKLYIQAIDPGVVLERILIYPEDKPMKKSYLGPEESFYTPVENK